MRGFLQRLLLVLLFWIGNASKGLKPIFTQVTYMYNLRRDTLTSYNRTFQYYLDNFNKMLITDTNMIIFGGNDVKDFVWERRQQHNTIFIEREIEEYENYWFADKVENFRLQFLQKPGFPFKHYPTYALKHYDIIMMSKMYVLHEALTYDKWNSDYMIWTDGGYSHIYYKANVYQPENVVMNYYKHIQPQWSAFTYGHHEQVFIGYSRTEARYINRYVKAGEEILAGNVGGYTSLVKDIKNAFENLLRITLEYGDFYSDEPVVTMLPIRFPFIYPNTLVLYLDQYLDVFNIHEEVNRLPPQHPRFFKKVITIVRGDSTHNSLTNEASNQSQINEQSNQQILKNEEIEQKNNLKRRILLLERQKKFIYQKTRIKITYFAIILILYVYFLSQRQMSQSNLLKRLINYANLPKNDLEV